MTIYALSFMNIIPALLIILDILLIIFLFVLPRGKKATEKRTIDSHKAPKPFTVREIQSTSNKPLSQPINPTETTYTAIFEFENGRRIELSVKDLSNKLQR